mgnify:CR=1 FL=1
MKHINELDLEPIIVKLVDQEEGLGWTVEYALNVEREYRKFLMLCKMFPKEHIVPSSPVDDFWHFHILDTRKYELDCNNFFGYFLHHFPYFGMRGEKDAENLSNAWNTTLKLYTDNFGAPDKMIWQSSKRCPNCGRRCADDATSEVRPRIADINSGAISAVLETSRPPIVEGYRIFS